MLDTSNGRRSVDNLLRSLYEKHRYPSERKDGNAAIRDEMNARKELAPIFASYVLDGIIFDWKPYLDAAGLETADNSTLKVKAKLNGRQKDLLDELGYNNWRKLSR
jgi:predicted metalloprotease with PDZ domain